MRQKNDPRLRSDAQRNRERILEVALAELSRAADTPLSAIAKKAGVGQGTFYRNFPNRETLVLELYRHGVQQIADTASVLLETMEPDRALRAWMDHLARFAMAKAGLAEAIRQALSTSSGKVAKPGHTPVTDAADLLLRACEEAGTIRPGVTPDDFMLAIAGLWQLAPDDNWQPQATRLLDIVMDGLRAGAPGGRGLSGGSGRP
ncbi:TetR/AcrR family transcriptional regulator [Streptomyces sp. LUP47B]|uniref:TetR/AcrR family transcriptional regulator n=1 Tax=Streptomyces sp. LUP47B TaxID=1890286 RepID=UPI000851CDCC|nr:TetR/AcrR family transcriptional regulator [Streptomyces sp. LUP47B]